MDETQDSEEQKSNSRIKQLVYTLYTKVVSWIKYVYKQLIGATFSNKLALVALTLSIIGFVRDCSIENKIQKTQYALNQNEYRPIVKIVSLMPKESKLIIRDSSYKINSAEDFLQIDTNIVQDISADLEFTANLFLTNTGNVRAKLFAEFYADTTCGEKVLEKIVNELPKRKSSGIISDYYPISEINPGDTITLYRNFKIQHIKDEMFTLHILIFYENELGQLFDTYLWVRFKVGDIMVRKVLIPEKRIVVTQVNKTDIEKMIKLIDHNSSSTIYEESKAEKIRKLIIDMHD